MQNIGQDSYGRNVEMEPGTDLDTYYVYDSGVLALTIEVPANKPVDEVFNTINALAPG